MNELGLVLRYCVNRIRICFEEVETADEIVRRGHADILANVDIIATLCQHYHTFPDLQTSEIEEWQKKYLAAHDEILPLKDHAPDSERYIHRAIIVATFYKLLRVVDALWNEDK